MNIIKENLFFVVMGAVVLLALVLFVVLVQPLKSKNGELEAKVRGLVEDMEGLVSKSTAKKMVLPNDAALADAKLFRQRYEEEDNATVDWLAKMHLRESLENLEPNLADDPGAYKFVYDKSVQKLQKDLADKKISATADTWHFWDWGVNVPRDPAQRTMAARELSLSTELVNIVLSPKLHVMQLDRLEVNPGESRGSDYKPMILAEHPDKTMDTYFEVYPFSLEVRMPVEYYELLLGELLHPGEGVPICIRDVSMTRIEDDPRIAARSIPPLFIGVRVDGWALDYRRQGKPAAPRAPFGRQ